MKKWNMAILGAGNIAKAMAEAINGLEQVNAYAVASRSLEKAEEFAAKWNFKKAYGSYEELVEDPEVELIYVATPHSHHFAHAKLCVEHDKPVLVEKAFTANAKQASELIHLAEEKKVFLTEAIWTRYLPAADMIRKLLADGAIGEPQSLTAEFSIPLTHKQRMYDPALAGGALLDLGMYTLTFASMYFGDEIVKVETECEKYETGVDGTDLIHYTYADGKEAHLRTSFVTGPVNEGTICGTEGSLRVENLNNYSAIQRYDKEGNPCENVAIPPQINGYEYEVLACIRALEAGKTECEEMPHAETLEIMKRMDELRAAWGVVFPFE